MSWLPHIMLKSRRHLNYFQRDIRWKLGLKKSFFAEAGKGRILLYHGICREDHLRFNTLFVTKKMFECHLRFYKKYFNIVSLDDFYRERFSNDRFTVCLTFDDGFANNYHYVLPLLEQYEVPVTFFVTGIRETGYNILWNDFVSMISRYGPKGLYYKDTKYRKNAFGIYVSTLNGASLVSRLRATGFGEKKEMMDRLSALTGLKDKEKDADYWEQMTVEQVRALSASRWATIGCHGYYHNDLAQLRPDQARLEITRSKEYLESVIDREIKSFAFPYGAYTREIKEETRKAGFTQLLATAFLFREDASDPGMRERMAVNPYISVVNQMHATIKGHYD